MNVRKRNTMVNSQAPTLGRYHQGPVLTNGALEFVYDKPVLWPLYGWTGGGVLTQQQFNAYQGPQLDYSLALTEAPIYGAGVPAGGTDFQNLIDESGDNTGEAQ